MTSPLWLARLTGELTLRSSAGTPVMVGCGSLLWSEGHPVEWNKTSSLKVMPSTWMNYQRGNTAWRGKSTFFLWFEAPDGFGAYFEELTVRLWKGTSIGDRTLSNSPGQTLHRLVTWGEVRVICLIDCTGQIGSWVTEVMSAASGSSRSDKWTASPLPFSGTTWGEKEGWGLLCLSACLSWGRPLSILFVLQSRHWALWVHGQL